MTYNEVKNSRRSKLDRCLVLHPFLPSIQNTRENGVQYRLDESNRLAEAIGLTVLHSEIIRINKPRPSFLIGKGNVDRLKRIIELKAVEITIIDTALSPVQQRNLENTWKCKVLDRTSLIIEIFGERARTKEGVYQVELAALTYQRSRLVRSWTHLERQRGGAGFMGGPGETQIEADRRLINDRINKLKKELKELKRTRALHRDARNRVPYPIIALVGYTNSGKSTLFNFLTCSNVYSQDQLFATLDPTMRALKLPSGQEAILLDTVGFISKIPHELIEAFQATLEEVVKADMIIHVHDISHPDSENQKSEVYLVLQQLGINYEFEVPIIEARNKIDCLSSGDKEYHVNQAARSNKKIQLTSAINGEGINELLNLLDMQLNSHNKIININLPWSDGKTLAWLYERGQIVHRHDKNESIDLTIKLRASDAARLERRLSN